MDNISFSIKIKYVTLVVGLGLTAIVTGLYLYQSTTVSITEISAIVGSGVALTTLIYTAININVTNRIQAESLILQKRNKAGEYIKRFTEPDISLCATKCIRLRKKIDGMSQDEIIVYLDQHEKEVESLHTLLNYYESIGVATRYGAIDEEIIREFFGEAFKRYWHVFSPYIQNKRNVFQTQRLFKEIEFLVKKWYP